MNALMMIALASDDTVFDICFENTWNNDVKKSKAMNIISNYDREAVVLHWLIGCDGNMVMTIA